MLMLTTRTYYLINGPKYFQGLILNPSPEKKDFHPLLRRGRGKASLEHYLK
jgi:hypothetical protein